MLNIPVFKRNFIVMPIGTNILILLNEHNHVVLTGKFYHELFRLIDGERTYDSLMVELGNKYSLPQIMAKMGKLEKKGYIVEKETDISNEEAAWWDYLDISPGVASKNLANSAVSLTVLDPKIDELEATNILQECGLNISNDDAVIELLLVDDYLNPALENINAAFLKSGKPWLLARANGASLWLGPLFIPSESACYGCLQTRLSANRQMEAFLQRQNPEKETSTSKAAFGPSTRFGLSWLALELSKWLAAPDTDHNLHEKIITFDQISLKQQEHILTKRPQCTVCGDVKSGDPKPLVLQSSKIIDELSGGHRTQTAYNTYKRLQKHISEITGIVTHLEELSEEDNHLLHVYIAGHNFAMLKDDLFFLAINMRARSGGKGMTDYQARASAVCESIERYCGVYPQHSLVKASFNEFSKQKRVIEPTMLQGFSNTQYENREAWNLTQERPGNHRVPRVVDKNQEIAWNAAWSLTNNDFCYLPAAFCYFGHREEGKITIIADSNGSAAGNTLEEAMLQGLMEVVERDSVAIWWYNMIQRQGVDLESFEENYIPELLEYYASIQRDLWVIDVSSDLGIPAFAGISKRTDQPVEDIILGFGCHPNPKVALFRALTEVNQFLPALLYKNVDGSTSYKFPDHDAIKWWITARVADKPYLVPDPSLPLKKYSDFDLQTSNDIKVEIENSQKSIEDAGLELLAMDMSHPDIDLNVVKVVVPGMCHFWRRLGQKRLYDVPVKMGWRDTPRLEADMNPVSIFF